MDPLSIGDCASAEDEYWYHVSPQNHLPLAPGVVRHTNLDSVDSFIAGLKYTGDTALVQSVTGHLMKDPESLSGMRLLAGLSDKRLYLDLSYNMSRVTERNGSSTLCGCAPNKLTRHSTAFFVNRIRNSNSSYQIAEAIAIYLVTAGLNRVAAALSAIDSQKRKPLLLSFISGREAQQNEAKRRGHGAEAALAELLEQMDIQIRPKGKAVNPMGVSDPHFSALHWTLCDRSPGETFSTDIAVLDKSGELRVCIQALIHSSDPGQFGVNKSDETVTIRTILDKTQRGEIWGLLDGVGYSENKKGTINKLIKAFHHFAQYNSLYKVALRCHHLELVKVSGIVFDAAYPPHCQEQMRDRYVPADVCVLREFPSESHPSESHKAIPAGWATIVI